MSARSVRLSVCLLGGDPAPPICRGRGPSVSPSVCLSAQHKGLQSIGLSVSQRVLSVCPSVCPSVNPSVCLPSTRGCSLSVCQSVSQRVLSVSLSCPSPLCLSGQGGVTSTQQVPTSGAVALGGPWWPSITLSGTQCPPAWWPSMALSGTQWLLLVLGGCWWPSVTLGVPRCPSVSLVAGRPGCVPAGGSGRAARRRRRR